jgi:hypothetical protein
LSAAKHLPHHGNEFIEVERLIQYVLNPDERQFITNLFGAVSGERGVLKLNSAVKKAFAPRDGSA